MDEIHHLLAKDKVQWDAICLSETWLKNDIVSYYEITN